MNDAREPGSEVPAEAHPTDDRPVRYGSGMLRRFGWFYRATGLGWVLRKLRFEDHNAETIRGAAAKGPLVYVLLYRSNLDHLALNTVLNRRRLPLSVWSNGTPSFFWQPVVEAWSDVFQRVRSLYQTGRADPVRSGFLRRTIGEAEPVAIFLQDRGGAPALSDGLDPLQAVLDAQEDVEGSVQLLPVICVWDRAPDSQGTGEQVRSFLLGSRERPNLLTRLFHLYTPQGPKPFVQVGEPVDLAVFVSRVSPERRLTSLRTLLRRFLKRESKVVRGPMLLPRPVLRDLVVDAPAMRRFAEAEARQQGTSLDRVRRQLGKEFDAVAADFSWPFIRFLSVVMKPLWTRVFSGYDIREEDLQRIRDASRNGTAVLVPCHRSHFDYLLLSWVLFWDDQLPPHVVAGKNLAIWPVSILLRWAGGFFIERSFADARVHAAVFGRYLRELLLHGYTVEFFIEGGRTRTGKLLAPRPGVLGMVLDAAASASGQEITLLPLSLAYQRVPEEGAYQSELGGAEKTKESVGELIRARRVLARRYGKVYLRVGEPIRCRDVVAPTGQPAWDARDEEDRRRATLATGERLVHRIGRAMTVLPTSLVAAALLAHHRQALPHVELVARVERLHAFVLRKGLPGSDALAHLEASVSHALERFTREGCTASLGDGAERVWRIVPEERAGIAPHANTILHAFAPAGLVAAAWRARAGEPVTVDDLVDDVAWLHEVLRREYTPDPDASPADRVLEGLEDLRAHGAVETDGAHWTVVDPERIGELHALLRGLLESYRVVVRAAAQLTDTPREAKAFARALAQQGDAWIADGTVTRPEALNAIDLVHAAKAWCALGALRHDDDRRLHPDLDAAAEADRRLGRMVRG